MGPPVTYLDRRGRRWTVRLLEGSWLAELDQGPRARAYCEELRTLTLALGLEPA